MIGVIGPKDAVESVYSIAEQLGRSHLVLKGTYRSVREAADLAEKLDAACEVLLFTGRVPHRLATASRRYHAKLHYVPDGPIDLYRAIALLSTERPVAPRSISMDTVSRSVIDEVFSDLALPQPDHVLPLDEIPGSWADIVSTLADFHQSCYEKGDVVECVTWLGQVFDELSAYDIPVRRVTHSHATYREALVRAELADSAARSQASQITAVLIRGADEVTDGSETQQALAQFAERLQGQLIPTQDDQTHMVYTTRGVLEAEVSRVQFGFVESLLPERGGWQVGYGVGSSAIEAASLAEKAFRRGSSQEPVHVFYSDGTSLTVDTSGESRPVQLRIGADNLETTQLSPPLRPYSMDRLFAAVRGLDPSGFTAKQFSTAYGVQERSARRILASLTETGHATRSGIQTSPGAGRPNTIYTVDLERLFAETQGTGIEGD